MASLSDFINPDFISFIDAKCDRFAFLCEYLKKNDIQYSIIPIGNKKHIYISFPKESYNPTFKIKTVLVHYDRYENSPGANDNSAAIFQVINWIRHNSIEQHNMRIFFTDGEELGIENGEPKQGAFFLAQAFKRLGITNDDIYVIDGCGRGNTLVVSTAGKNIAASSKFKKDFDDLYERTIDLVKSTSPQNWITAPVPYGDNAGFIASGIPAVAITVLPQEEATEYLRSLQKDSLLKQSIMQHENSYRPLTWAFMNTPNDKVETLTLESFLLMEKFLNNLARCKNLA